LITLRRNSNSTETDTKEVLKIKKIVDELFNVTDVRWEEDIYKFYIASFDPDDGEKFEKLRSTLKKMNYIPILRKEKGEYTIIIELFEPGKFKSKVMNLVMFLLTIISTVWAGAVLWAPWAETEVGGFPMGMISLLWNPELMFYGLIFFAVPLLLILGVHEFGHYFMAKYHKVNASLPFFIPVPPIIGPLGTFGAFISIREPIPNKRALVEIGAAGPIAGFLVAIPVTIIGLILTAQDPHYFSLLPGQEMIINKPLLFGLFTQIFSDS